MKIMRNVHLTNSRRPNEYDRTMTMANLYNWTWPKLKPTNLIKPTNLNLTSGVLLTSVPDVFFLRKSKARLGDLSKLTAPAYFWGVKLMFVGDVNFSHVPTLRFVGVNIFWSYSNQNSIILIRSCELATR